MRRRLSTGRALMLIFIAFGFGLWLIGMFGALLTDPAATDPTPTPTIQVRVIPESPVPATSTQMPDIFTIPSSSPELVFATPMPTSTGTPTPEPTSTSTPESTRVPATPIQKGEYETLPS